MKQIILRVPYDTTADQGGPCLGRLALVWAGYGSLVALVWRVLPDDPAAGAAAWAIALLGGLALAAWTMEV
jgi:hypothetical protein